MSFCIEYDDDQLAVVDKINEELKKEGIHVRFEFDDNEHDGFEICSLVKEPPDKESKNVVVQPGSGYQPFKRDTGTPTPPRNP